MQATKNTIQVLFCSHIVFFAVVCKCFNYLSAGQEPPIIFSSENFFVLLDQWNAGRSYAKWGKEGQTTMISVENGAASKTWEKFSAKEFLPTHFFLLARTWWASTPRARWSFKWGKTWTDAHLEPVSQLWLCSAGWLFCTRSSLVLGWWDEMSKIELLKDRSIFGVREIRNFFMLTLRLEFEIKRNFEMWWSLFQPAFNKWNTTWWLRICHVMKRSQV